MNDFSGPIIVPTGVDELAAATAVMRSSRVKPLVASASGLAWTRTAKCCWPKISTWATPLSVDSRCAITVSANSSTSEIGTVSEDRLMKITGKSAGFTLMKNGGMVICRGRCFAAVVIADCTSSAAPSMLRSRSNCMVIDVMPWPLVEIIELRPAMVENCFSSGVATEAAMVSGLAPGRSALTTMVGKSTRGSAATGRSR